MKKAKNMNKVVCCVILILVTVLLVAGTLNVVFASKSTTEAVVETAKVVYQASKPEKTIAATTATVEETVEELQFPIVFSTKEGKKTLVFLSEVEGVYVENGHELPFVVEGNSILVTSPTGAVKEYRLSYDWYLVRIDGQGARVVFYRQ